jgi:hypothetical protein
MKFVENMQGEGRKSQNPVTICFFLGLAVLFLLFILK